MVMGPSLSGLLIRCNSTLFWPFFKGIDRMLGSYRSGGSAREVCLG